MVWDGVDKRKFPRANYKCLVTVRKKSGMQTYTTQTENIGAGGICVILPEPLAIFSHVDLVITLLHGMPPLKCAGSIVWAVKSSNPKKAKINCYDTGVEFVDLPKEDAARVNKVVNDLVAKQPTLGT
jgi:Tfp pilus assembly protein PilZ